MNKSVSYDDFLMAKLKDRNYAAGYVETHLELENDEAPDPALLALALKDVAQALAGDRFTPEEVKLHLEKLDRLLSNGGSEVIYNLAEWLQFLGLKLTVKSDNNRDKKHYSVIADEELVLSKKRDETMPISDRYQDSLIARLKNPNYAAGYLDACLAENEPDAELLHLVLSNIAQALAGDRLTPEEVKVHLEKLDRLLSNGGSEVIYNLAEWLHFLGLKLTVKVDNEPEKIDSPVTDNVVNENVAEALVKT